MEIFFATLKSEYFYPGLKKFGNLEELDAGLGGYIRYYNTRRRHSALDYRTPEEFEAASANGGPQWPNAKKS